MPAANFLTLTVRCKRCSEIIEARLNLSNDLSADYGDDGRVTYHCRKGLIGNQHCYQTIELQLQFDANHRLIDQQITGGEFVDQ